MTIPAELARTMPDLVQEAERLFANLRRGSQRALRALEQLARARGDTLRVSRRLQGWVAERRAVRRRQSEYGRFKQGFDRR